MAPGKQPTKTQDQYSAGGVVYRKNDGAFEIALILTHPERRWQLPKGMLDAGETPEQAAVREVREETGITARPIGQIGGTEYQFIGNYDGERKRFHKRVAWFLMEYVSGDVVDHDDEVAEARWVTPLEAEELLAFKNERDIVVKAIGMIDGRSQGQQLSPSNL